MPLYNFNQKCDNDESRDSLPDFRSDIEKLHTPLGVFDNCKPDLAMYERLAEEVINISGAFVTLFLKLPLQGSERNPNDIWDEDADPVYANGVILKAFVKLNEFQLELTKFGVDAPLSVKVVFARTTLGKAVGYDRMLAPGDVIEVPYNRAKIDLPLRFRVKNESDAGNINYRWVYYSADCELITSDKSLKVPYQNRTFR
jgi:hypothetical protein